MEHGEISYESKRKEDLEIKYYYCYYYIDDEEIARMSDFGRSAELDWTFIA